MAHLPIWNKSNVEMVPLITKNAIPPQPNRLNQTFVSSLNFIFFFFNFLMNLIFFVTKLTVFWRNGFVKAMIVENNATMTIF